MCSKLHFLINSIKFRYQEGDQINNLFAGRAGDRGEREHDTSNLFAIPHNVNRAGVEVCLCQAWLFRPSLVLRLLGFLLGQLGKKLKLTFPMCLEHAGKNSGTPRERMRIFDSSLLSSLKDLYRFFPLSYQ